MPRPATSTEPKTYTSKNAAAMRSAVRRIVAKTPVTDLHTHLYAPPFGSLLLYGADELLTYHYLIAEVLRATRMPCDAYWALSKAQQADLIWQELFVNRTPYSEACRGVVTVFHAFGLDLSTRDLNAYRKALAGANPGEYIDTVFRLANVTSAVMTNDPFDALERPVWQSDYSGDPRFHAALRIDPLLNDWANACPRLKEWGYDTEPSLSSRTLTQIRRFLSDQLQRMNALYMAVSLPPTFAFPEDSGRGTILSECVVPTAAEHKVPFAMMIGVKRAVNPALRLAGDGVARADVSPVEALCARYPDNKFMVTMLARENQHELCVAARKFPNLFLFGCWWFLNNPSLIEEMTRMRFELLGSSVVPQHSDARILEQVIYKWDHSRRIIGGVLADKYADLLEAGWTITDGDIRKDAARLLGGGFWEFLES